MSQCLICEREFYTAWELFDMAKESVCDRCRQRFMTSLKKTMINGISVYYLFEYTEEIMSSLITLKGIGIKEMADVLILPEIRRKLRGQFKHSIFLYMPSLQGDDEERGFRHSEVLFHGISEHSYYPLTKSNGRKQALCTYKERKEIGKYMQCNGTYAYHKADKVVLVDDVITSGSTLFSAAQLLGISDYDILVLINNHYKE